MNQLTHPLPAFGARDADAAPMGAADALQARFALRVTARLTERAQDLGPDVTERLRFAREQALERARAARGSSAPVAMARGGATSPGSTWWLKVASVLPALALVAGLVLIQRWQDNAQVSVAAEVDAALLSDDLPPTAYSDAGFAEFLKTPNE